MNINLSKFKKSANNLKRAAVAVAAQVARKPMALEQLEIAKDRLLESIISDATQVAYATATVLRDRRDAEEVSQ